MVGKNKKKEIIAYARLLYPDTRYFEPSIGRICTRKDVRNYGYGRELVREAIYKCNLEYPDTEIRIQAQIYLLEFYQSFGFEVDSEPYEEDGLEQVDMILGVEENLELILDDSE